MHDPALELTKELVTKASITPQDAGCQRLVSNMLCSAGFKAEPMPFGEVDNLWLRRKHCAPLFVFAGHTDVVPPGPMDKWRFDPFAPTLHEGYLYGRGTADMKASIAAFVTAASKFTDRYPNHHGSIAMLLTSDEEGPAVNGTTKVIDELSARNESIDYCIVGEPTSEEKLGDVVKIGRRGSLHGFLVIHGVRGHVAYPHLAHNAVHQCAPVISKLAATVWDNGNEQFPPTSFQITDINTASNAENAVPGEVFIRFNFRHSTASTVDSLTQRVRDVLTDSDVDYELDWAISGSPFVTEDGKLVSIIKRAISDEVGIETRLSTSGGTSDGRFIAPTGAQVVELGPVNKTIHKVNECVAVDTPHHLANIYYRILVSILT